MTDHLEYTLTQPPSCPRKWDHLSLNVVHRFRTTLQGGGHLPSVVLEREVEVRA